jgi:hypothetical protein
MLNLNGATGAQAQLESARARLRNALPADSASGVRDHYTAHGLRYDAYASLGQRNAACCGLHTADEAVDQVLRQLDLQSSGDL